MSSDLKPTGSHASDPETRGVKHEVAGVDDFDFSPEQQRKIISRIDRRLVVTVGLMYCVSLMDRTNLGSANIAGMAADLRLNIGTRYSVITLVFFVTYIVFQPPSTVIVRKIGPRIHLAAITTLWGGCMIGMGFVNDWQAMAGMRVLLGVLEAGFFPSCVYLLSTWYTRCKLNHRCVNHDEPCLLTRMQMRSASGTPSFTSSAVWLQHLRVSWPTA